MNKEKKRSPIKYVLTVLLLTALLFSGVYAWIFGDVVPKIGGTMSIGNEAGIILRLNEQSQSLIDMNEVYGITTTGLGLTEVSSADGQNFFKRRTDVFFIDDKNNEIITYAKATPVESGKAGNYIDLKVTMMLKNNSDADYYIYFLDGKLGQDNYETGFTQKDDNYITDNGLKAMRLALQVDSLANASVNTDIFRNITGTSNYIALFGNSAENATDGYATEAVIETGEIGLIPPGQESTEESIVNVCGEYKDKDDTVKTFGRWTDGVHGDNIVIHSFDECSIGDPTEPITLYGDALPESSDYLFILNNKTPLVTMHVRIWLEGGSYYCTDGQITPDDTSDLDDVELALYFAGFAKNKTE